MTVVILGGGIGGLSTAHYLTKLTKHKIIVIEGSNRLGGWIRSVRHPSGLILEQGPRTLRPRTETGLNALDLIDDLNLSSRIRPILSSHPAAKNRFVYVKGQLHKLPSSLLSLFRKTPPFSKSLIRALAHDLFAKPKYVDDDTIYNFAKRRFGQEIADYAISPLICGICGGDAKHISVNFLMSEFFEKEQKYKSVIRGIAAPWRWKPKKKVKHGDSATRALKEKWSSYTMHEGLETLPITLGESLMQKEVEIIRNCQANEINLYKKFVRANGNEIAFDHLVSTLPAFELAQLVYENHYYHLSRELLHIPYVSIITVNLVYKKSVLDIDGFGFLTPPSENLPILGIIFDSCYAPFKDWTVLTVMMGGYAFNKFFGQNHTDEFAKNTAIKYANQILRIEDAPDICNVSVLRDCIPQHAVGHRQRIDRILNHINYEKFPLYLVGNAFKGTGINDVITSAKETAEAIVKSEQEEQSEYPVPRYVVDYL